MRFLLVPLGAALIVTPFVHDAGTAQVAARLLCGVLLVVLSLRRGDGRWQRLIV